MWICVVAVFVHITYSNPDNCSVNFTNLFMQLTEQCIYSKVPSTIDPLRASR